MSAIGLYRVALHAYPKAFRDAYGDDMVALLRDQLRDEPAPRVVARLVTDLLISIPTRHLEAHMTDPSPRTIPVLLTAVSVTALATTLVMGTSAGAAGIGLTAAAAAGSLAFLAWRNARAVTDTRPLDANWWKPLVGGVVTLFLFAVVTSSIGELPDGGWLVAMAVLLGALGSIAFGLALGVAHLARGRQGPSVARS